MTRIYVDATPLVALGEVGELDLLASFEGTVVVPESVRAEVVTEPASTALERFLEENPVEVTAVEDGLETARDVLDEPGANSDVRLLAGVLSDLEGEVGLVSDDRRLRTVARALGASVTGTFGVVIRGAVEDLTPAQAKRVVRRLDSHGLHMTGELRERALGET